MANTVLNIEIWNCNMKGLLYYLMAQSKSAYLGGLSFGKLEVVSNHKMDKQKWSLNGKEIDPHFDLTDDQLLEIYNHMEGHRISNIKSRNIKPITYAVRATRKETNETWFIYKDWTTSSKEHAESEARDCNRIWGNEISYEVIELSDELNNPLSTTKEEKEEVI